MVKSEKLIKLFKGEHRFLSNHYPVEIEFGGMRYPSLEHAYQSAKTFSQEDREKIRRALFPRDARRLGNRVKLRFDWERVKPMIMRGLLRKKFAVAALRRQLVLTHPLELQHGNSHRDEYWGMNLTTGQGNNYLGKMLMDLRNEFVMESAL